MSLIKTLTKVAIGIAVAKGVQTITSSRTTTTTRTTATRSPGRGRSYSPNDLESIMDEVLGTGRRTPTSGASRKSGGAGSLDDLLSGTQRTSRSRTTTPTDGLGGILGGKSGGNLGDLIGGMLGTTTAAREAIRAGTGTPMTADREEELEAALLLRCMIAAIKADGQLDAEEKARLMQAVGDASRTEIDFINRELAAPPDLDALLADIPRGLEEKAYVVSLMAIDLDQRPEAEYLHQLASGLGLEPAEVNAIHDRFGAPQIYGA